MVCELCGTVTLLGDCIPCANDSTGFGCPLPDCGGMMHELKRA